MTRRKRYTAKFKREALRRANEDGVTDVLVTEELGISTLVSHGSPLSGFGRKTVTRLLTLQTSAIGHERTFLE
jgi:hypothetical protein